MEIRSYRRTPLMIRVPPPSRLAGANKHLPSLKSKHCRRLGFAANMTRLRFHCGDVAFEGGATAPELHRPSKLSIPFPSGLPRSFMPRTLVGGGKSNRAQARWERRNCELLERTLLAFHARSHDRMRLRHPGPFSPTGRSNPAHQGQLKHPNHTGKSNGLASPLPPRSFTSGRGSPTRGV